MIGMVLEGGAERTIYSCGVCDGLLETNAPMPDYVIGVSAGIAYGVSYVAKQKRRNLDILLRYVNDKRYMGKRNMIKRDNRSYFGLKFIYETIPNELIPFDYETFEAFPGHVEAVVTNLDTGEAEYFEVPRRDEHFTILQATCALPFLFPVYHIGGIPCMDGGIVDGIPYERAFEMGCDKVVVIATKERSYMRQPDKILPMIKSCYRKYPKLGEAMEKRAEAYNRSREKLFQLEQEGKALVFTPKNTENFSRTEKDVSKIQALWDNGFEDGVARAEEFRKFFAE